MNLQSEIQYFSDLADVDQARLLALFMHELTIEARQTYGPVADKVLDAVRLRFVNEMVSRVTRFMEQLLGDDQNRPADEVLIRMGLIYAAYTRAIQGFDRYDATVTMGPA